MDMDALIKEIIARVQDKVAALEEPSGCEDADKAKLLILTQQHGTICHEALECEKLGAYYQTQCALLADYAVDVKEYEAVIAYNMTNEALGKIAHGIMDNGYTRVFCEAILAGRKLYLPKEEVELYTCTNAPRAFLNVLQQNLKVLTDSGVVIAPLSQIAALILGDAAESGCCKAAEAPKADACEVCAEPEEVKEASLCKRIITEKDLISLGNERVKKIYIPKKAILSDLAQEYAKRHKMTLVRADISSDKRN